MQFHNPAVDIYIPNGVNMEDAFSRITHLGIGAHQDDLEIMAFHGISQCYDDDHKWFGGVTCTNGSGSPRTGSYAGCSNEKMREIRRQEQREAALKGRFGVMAQLDYESSVIRDPADRCLKEDLKKILAASRPSVVYTHNPADKHDTHIAVVIPVIQALRELPSEQRPQNVYGCEGWRGLDWMMDDQKIALDVSGKAELGEELIKIFRSQVAGGKRYDLAASGRKRANATYRESHATDDAELVWFAMDLTSLVNDDALDMVDFITQHIQSFQDDVRQKISRQLA